MSAMAHLDTRMVHDGQPPEGTARYREGTDSRKPAEAGTIPSVERVDPRAAYKAFMVRRMGKTSPYAFAERVGMPRPRVYDVLNDRRELTEGELMKIADAYGVGTAELFAELALLASRLEERNAIRVEGTLAEGYADERTAAALTSGATARGGAERGGTVTEPAAPPAESGRPRSAS